MGVYLVYARMFANAMSRLVQRPYLKNAISLRDLQRLSRNTAFASLCPSTKGLVLNRLLSTKPPSPSPEAKTMSTHAHTHFEGGNLPYAASFEDKGKLAIPPAKHLAIGSLIYERRW